MSITHIIIVKVFGVPHLGAPGHLYTDAGRHATSTTETHNRRTADLSCRINNAITDNLQEADEAPAITIFFSRDDHAHPTGSVVYIEIEGISSGIESAHCVASHVARCFEGANEIRASTELKHLREVIVMVRRTSGETAWGRWNVDVSD